MASASPDAHPLNQAGEGSARTPRLHRPRWRSGDGCGPGGAGRRERRSPRSQGRGAAPRPRIPRPGASAPALRPGSTELFPSNSLDGGRTARCLSPPPPFSFISFSCSFLPPFLFPGGGCARLRQKLASDAKTKVVRSARPRRRGPASSRLFLPLRARPHRGPAGSAGKLFAASCYIPAHSQPSAPLPVARDPLALVRSALRPRSARQGPGACPVFYAANHKRWVHSEAEVWSLRRTRPPLAPESPSAPLGSFSRPVLGKGASSSPGLAKGRRPKEVERGCANPPPPPRVTPA
ncbi:uncharacterized protein [Macaca fascicularis]|uniref:uncharacterized protein n=1 Tax=Macaca fascicularis TaxID=9541 RepID=UPI003D155E97